MANSGGTITAPVSIDDVRTVLGQSSYDLGTLCRASTINMWSRFKPVIWNDPGINLTNSLWWKGQNGKCGIDFSNAQVVSYRDIPSKMTTDKRNGWGYSVPTSYFRLLDFNKYMHTAVPPISGFSVTAKVAVNGTLMAQCSLGITTEDKNSPGSLTFDDITGDASGDITNLSQYNLGIVVTDLNGNYKGRVVGSTTTALTVTYSVASLVQGSSYNVYPFLAKNKMGQYDVDVSNVYYTMPNTAVQQFKVVSKEEAEGITISLTAKYMYLNGVKTSVTYTVSVTVKSGRSFNTNAVYLRFTNNDPSSPIQSGEDYTSLPNFTVTPTSPYTKTGIFSAIRADKDYYVYLTLDTGNYTRRVNIMQTIDPTV